MPALVVALGVTSLFARFGERVARRGPIGFCRFRHRHQRQQERLPDGCIDCRALLRVDPIVTARTRLQEHGVHPLQHGRCITARPVGAQHGGVEVRDEHLARGVKQARIRTTKTIDRLLRIPHQEHARLRARTRIAGKPALQNAPLHRVRVLKLVEQQMLVARIESHLQVSRRVFVLHQAGGFPFQVGEVHRARLALVGLIAIDERIAQGEQRRVDGAHVHFLAACLIDSQRFAHSGVQGNQGLRLIIANRLDERLGRLAGARLAGLRMERAEQVIESLFAGGFIRHIDRTCSRGCHFNLRRTFALGGAALP